MRLASWAAILLVGASLGSSARALETPNACSTEDPHIQCVNYDPINRFKIVATKGMALSLTFGNDEQIERASAGTDGYFNHEKPEDMGDRPVKQYLTLWPEKVGRTNLIVLTNLGDKVRRLYQFDVTINEPPPDGGDNPGAVYGLVFTYNKKPPPPKVVAKKEEPKKEESNKDDAAKKEPEKQVASATPAPPKFGKPGSKKTPGSVAIAVTPVVANGPAPIPLSPPAPAPIGPAASPCPNGMNCAYLARGDEGKVIAPVGVWDNGRDTTFVFAPNTPLPAIYIADGKKEEIAQSSPHGNVIIVHAVAREFHLYHGQRALNVYNQRQDTIGHDPGTGTDSPFVDRVVIHADLPK